MPDEAPKTPSRPGPRLVPTRRAPEPMERNPYAPPKAALERKTAEDAGEWRERGVVAPALHGLVWIRDAWRIFWERPWTWLGAVFLYLLCNSLETLSAFVVDGGVSVLGYVDSFLDPFFVGGFVLMAHRQSQEEDIRVLDVFDGFHASFTRLAFFGVVSLLLLGSPDVVMEVVPELAEFGPTSVKASFSWRNTELNLRFNVTVGGGILIGSVFLLDFVAMFFPTVLVVLAGRGIRESLLAGTGAILKNWKAFLVFGVVISCLAFFLVMGNMLFVHWSRLAFPVLTDMSRAIGDKAQIIIMWWPIMFGIGFFPLMSYAATRDIFYNEG